MWRIGPDGLKPRLLGSEEILLPNRLALDRRGNLYVSDSLLGAIWRIPRGGSAEVWLEHALLVGDGSLFGIPIGANGTADRRGAIFVSNSDLGTVVRIPLAPSGAAGEPRMVAEDPSLRSADGTALDVRGGVYVAVVTPDGALATLATAEDGLDSPASLAFGTGTQTCKTLFVTEFPPSAGPGVATLRVGVPGWPVR